MNLNRKQFSTEFAGKNLTLEVSRLADQASASVLGQYGETVVLVTVVMTDQDKPGDYFPLLVDYEERFYAAGKIIGSRFMRREGRPSDDAILSARIIDRTIRPLFNQKLRREIQVVATILSVDERNDPDFVALMAASTALGISEIPWDGPVAGVKILKKRSGEIIINPENPQTQEPYELLAFVAGTADRINMIELEGLEASEQSADETFQAAYQEIGALVNWQKEIIAKIGKPKAKVPLAELSAATTGKIDGFLAGRLEPAIYVTDKQEREQNLSQVQKDLKDFLVEAGIDSSELAAAEHFLEAEIDGIVHRNILEKNKRPDGRRLDEVRELGAEVALLPRTHGSALFVRGNTQALAVTTLGPPNAEQLVENIEFSGRRRFMLHYNFPPYSVGEIGPFRGPGRREIGHGSLAAKALKNVLPTQDQFPYTIRVVSEILSSNGSSSMATVCASSLSMMDAGVPIKKPVAGIAMGLMVGEAGAYKILTDIQGPEDHYGDMDFKVAGTTDGITAVQLDVKINGLTPQMIGEVLERAKKARLQILDVMNKTLAQPRPAVSPHAPVIMVLQIPSDRIGEVIGPGGKMINSIIGTTGASSIDIEQTGKVFITGPDAQKTQAAYDAVKSIVKVFEIGEIVEGEVVRIMDFGAIIQLGEHHDGMVHVSELKAGYVKNVTDVVKIGDRVRAKVIRVEDGRIGLSLKNLS